jgi:hypothetical protein
LTVSPIVRSYLPAVSGPVTVTVAVSFAEAAFAPSARSVTVSAES